MNVEEYRDYCLSFGADVEEKLPFVNAPDNLARDLIRNSYEIVKAKYTKKK